MAFERRDLSDFARGDDWTIKFTLRDNETKLPIDITGFSFWMTLKADIDAADPGDAQIGPIVAGSPDATSGIIYITFPKAVTGSLTPQTYNYDLQQVDDQGTVQTLLIGKVKVVKDVTLSIS